jgi:hypothetical protein
MAAILNLGANDMNASSFINVLKAGGLGFTNFADVSLLDDDGTSASGNPGVSNITAVALRIGRSSGGTTLDGAIAEIGIWGALAFSSAQYGNLTTNQRNAYLGYNF